MTNAITPGRVLVVDDHPIIREGLAMRIATQPDLVVCGEAATEQEALRLVRETRPDLAIIDISLKNSNGIDLIKQIKNSFPSTKMLVFSGHQESLYAERALRAGALGYVNKQEPDEKVLEAIRAVLAGSMVVCPEITKKLVDHALGNSGTSKSPIERLTDRELEILRMIGEGLTTSAIANRLFLSTHTIDTHRENIKRKLNVKNSGELVRTAVQWVLETG